MQGVLHIVFASYEHIILGHDEKLTDGCCFDV